MAAVLGGPSLGDPVCPVNPSQGSFTAEHQLCSSWQGCPGVLDVRYNVTQPGRAFRHLHTSASRVLDPVLLKPPCSLA